MKLLLANEKTVQLRLSMAAFGVGGNVWMRKTEVSSCGGSQVDLSGG